MNLRFTFLEISLLIPKFGQSQSFFFRTLHEGKVIKINKRNI